MKDYLLKTSFEAVGGPQDCADLPYQHQEAVVQEGPSPNQNFHI